MGYVSKQEVESQLAVKSCNQQLKVVKQIGYPRYLAVDRIKILVMMTMVQNVVVLYLIVLQPGQSSSKILIPSTAGALSYPF